MKNRTKILIVALVAVFVSVGFFTTVVGASNDTLVITSEEVSGARGETVEVVLNVTQNPGFAAMRIKVSESKDFELISVTNGSVMRDITTGKNILWDSASNSTATGTLVTLTYKISDTAKLGKNEIKVTLIDCFNEDLLAVNVSLTNIVINVESQPEVEETTTATVPPVETTEATTVDATVATEEQTTTEAEVVETTEKTNDVTEEQTTVETNGGVATEEIGADTEEETPAETNNGGQGSATATEPENSGTESQERDTQADTTPVETETEGKEQDKKGCFGTLAASPLVIITLMGVALVFKKKQ